MKREINNEKFSISNYYFKQKKVKNDENKTADVVAAVGAGLVPATMALLMPMFFGRRRRRSIGTIPTSHLDLEKSNQLMNQPIYHLFM